jgi:hypothetical protein
MDCSGGRRGPGGSAALFVTFVSVGEPRHLSIIVFTDKQEIFIGPLASCKALKAVLIAVIASVFL